ncbi:MAG: translation initiation factor IF-2 [Acidobacteriota bacterium]|nr:translation initiation factor IF-2 [Acidobacteriota bacterium]
MTLLGNKVRVYDLAKELKQDTKRIIEELRREGADISVPSNSVSKELAEKIRNRYFPKKEVAPVRTIKVIKKTTAAPSAAEEMPLEAEIPAVHPVETAAPAIAAPPTVEENKEEKTITAAPVLAEDDKPKVFNRTIKLAKRVPAAATAETETTTAATAAPAPLPVDEEKIEPVVVEDTPPVEETVEAAPVEEVIEAPPAEPAADAASPVVKEAPPAAAAPPTAPPVAAPPQLARPTGGTQVKKLVLNKKALESGIKQGDRIVAPPPPPQPQQQQKLEKGQPVGRGNDRDRRNLRDGGRKPEFRGTPGETATPQTVYTPPPDTRKQGRRGAVKKGPDRRNDGAKGGRFEERELDFQRPRSIEERILDQVGKSTASDLKPARLVEGATVREFAEKLGIVPKDVVQLLIKRGVFATLNQPIGEKLAHELGEQFGYSVSFVPFEEMVVEQEFEELIAADSDDVEVSRAPVVTVMGHVDHGKTSLLDAIRSANVAEGEAGGITQHIGAYSVFVPNPDNPAEPRRVVFLDTPGHEAFTMMRARGAKATDIVILVVAADDGVMPQTIEAVEHSKAAGVPIIVAINKTDKPDANPDKVKQGLAGLGLQPQDWGGDTEMIPVSAKKRQNLDTLLETVLLQADIMELKASPTRRASGVVLEAKLDKGRGSVATVLVQQGTLRVGDPFIVGQVNGKVRAMFSDRGEPVTEAVPATPVEVLGLQGMPQAGDTFQVVANIDQAVTIAGQRQMKARQAAMLKTTKRGIESLGQAEVKELLVILKTDVQGSVEVLRATLEKLSTEKVKVRVIRAGVGAINESDVLLASATQADNTQTAVVIIGFNVRPEARAAEVAKQEDVDIRLHSIIYKIEEEIKAAQIGMLDAIEREVILGKALVQEVFRISRVGTVAGCRVTDGVIRRQARARLIRDGVVIWEGDIDSLRRFKEDVSEVRTGFECGIGLVNFNDIKVSDEIEAYIIERVAATEL